MYPGALLRLVRPHFALSGLVLYGLGLLFAAPPGAGVPLARAAAGYLVVLAGHLAINAANDYYDREDDRHGTPTPFSGGSGVLLVHPGLALAALGLAIGLSVLAVIGAGLYAFLYGPNAAFVGLVLLALLTGWAYSAPPVRLSSRGWGEVSTAFAFVFLPGFGYAVATGGLDPGFLPLALPLLLLGGSFILAVELPDREADLAAGRRNFTVRYGRRAAVHGMLLCSLAAVVVSAVPVLNGAGYLLGALLLLPVASSLYAVRRPPADRDRATRLCVAHMATLNLCLIGCVALFAVSG